MNEQRVKLEFDISVPPIKEITAICGNCKAKLESREWRSYGYIPQTKARIRAKFSKCTFCGITFDHIKAEKKAVPHWVKLGTNEYKAVAKDGDFLVWKDGYVWKCRYRKHGEKEPEWVERYFFSEGAFGKCEQNKNWVV